MIPRREFIRHLTLTAIALAAGPAMVSAITRTSAPAAPAPAATASRKDTFSRLRGERFHVRDGSASGQWVSLEDVRPGRTQAKVESFSLRFHGPASAPLAHGSYQFTHDELGAMNIYVVPGTTEAGAVRYCATFTQLV
jgi:hypothetical protein